MTIPILSARGVNKSFGAITAAEDVTVEVAEGSIISLIGTNGAGKTTFVNMVTGYITPDSGSIKLRDQEITGLGPRAITRLGVHRSFQIAQLCNELTVEENMLVAQAVNAEAPPSFFGSGRSAAARKRARETLARFDIERFAGHLIPELSGGVKKLLDIAMAMAGDTEIMLLDEPTSGVAADEKFPLMDLVIGALREKGVTVLFVEHDMEVVTRYSDRIVAFYSGRIIANDTPDEVLSDPDVRRYVTGTAA
ncbi:MAG: branched-chain amino acid transport system ATP-binding protein [Paracoccaceae bacterium]|jgi:branched-chain amino acid transport system ATP-binding protein